MNLRRTQIEHDISLYIYIYQPPKRAAAKSPGESVALRGPLTAPRFGSSAHGPQRKRRLGWGKVLVTGWEPSFYTPTASTTLIFRFRLQSSPAIACIRRWKALTSWSSWLGLRILRFRAGRIGGGRSWRVGRD